jgi:hypothetical protein
MEGEVVDLELDADSEVQNAAEPPARPAAASRPPAPAPRAVRPARRAAPSAPMPAVPLRVGAAQVRTLLAEEPELLEPGLAIYVDESGQVAGAGYATDVGPIDLLARDGRGALVVVVVADPGDQDSLVPDVLQRVGWVRKHLGKGRHDVRAIVLLESGGQDLSYAAAAVASTVSFKTWRVSVGFDDVEV